MLVVAFYAVFLFIFSFIAAAVLFGQVGFAYNTVGLFALVVLGVAALFVLFRRLSGTGRGARVLQVICIYDRLWLPVLLSVFFLIQVAVGCALRFESSFDFAAVYKGAVSWVETGTFADYYDYFDWFPNNLGAMTLLSIVFRGASLFGITDFFTVGVIFNSLLVTLTVLFSYLSVKKLTSGRTVSAVAVLFFFLLSPAFYVVGAAFYTDSLSMLFPVLFYYFYLCLKEGRNPKRYLVLMGLAAAIGILIKSTVLIMVIAVLIDAFFNRHFRKMVYIFVSVTVSFMLLQFSLHACLYSDHLNPDLAAQKNTPIGHWVMMGLNPDSQGAYHPDDYTFTRSFTDPEERDAAISAEIRKRLKEAGVSGNSKLFTNKLIKAFGDGTFALSDFLDDGPVHSSSLHPYVLYSGEYYYKYKYATQTPLLVVYFFAVLGGVVCLRRAVGRRGGYTLAPYVAVFGLMLFLAFWESSSRYFLNFVPIIYCMAGLGASAVSKGFGEG